MKITVYPVTETELEMFRAGNAFSVGISLVCMVGVIAMAGVALFYREPMAVFGAVLVVLPLIGVSASARMSNQTIARIKRECSQKPDSVK